MPKKRSRFGIFTLLCGGLLFLLFFFGAFLSDLSCIGCWLVFVAVIGSFLIAFLGYTLTFPGIVAKRMQEYDPRDQGF